MLELLSDVQRVVELTSVSSSPVNIVDGGTMMMKFAALKPRLVKRSLRSRVLSKGEKYDEILITIATGSSWKVLINDYFSHGHVPRVLLVLRHLEENRRLAQ